MKRIFLEDLSFDETTPEIWHDVQQLMESLYQKYTTELGINPLDIFIMISDANAFCKQQQMCAKLFSKD